MAWLWFALASVAGTVHVRAADPPVIAPAANAPLVVDVDERREAATFVRIEPPNQLVLEIAGAERRRAASAIVEWGRIHEPLRGTGVLLRGGSLLAATAWKLEGDRLHWETSIAASTIADRNIVRALVEIWPADLRSRDRLLKEWLASSAERDQVFLENGDTLTGRVLGWAPLATDNAKPSVPEDEFRLRVELPRGEVSVPRGAVRAVVLRTSASRTTAIARPEWILGLRDGSRLQVERLDIVADRVELRLIDGLRIDAPAAALWSEICFVQPLHGRATYLSDREPLGYKHVPFLTQEWSYARDANVLGGGLRSGKRLSLKGLGMHATSRLAYDLGGKYQAFQAELALDDAADGQGSVVFRVYVDRGDGKWQSAYSSGIVRGGDPPVPLAIDVTGAQQLALIVDAADHGDQRDYANWLGARLVSASEAKHVGE